MSIEKFTKHGNKASYHYADDSCREWDLAKAEVVKAIAVFDASPEHHAEMREIAKGFLWASEFSRKRPDNKIEGGE